MTDEVPAGGEGPGPAGGEGPSEGPVAAVEAAVEGVPAAVSLAPSSTMPSLGGELVLPLLDQGGTAPVGADSIRAGILQAGPLALAGLVVNGVNVVVTILLARLLTTRGYGQLAQLNGLFLIVSMPGSAVVVAVVRRVTAWHGQGQAHLVQRWARRLHRQGTAALVLYSVVVVAVGPTVAHLLGQASAVGTIAMMVAGGVWVLLCLDRGLLQAHRNYGDLAVNLLIEGGGRTVGMLVLAGAGFGVAGATLGFLGAEVVAAVQARMVADRVWAAEAAAEDQAAGSTLPTLRQAVGSSGRLASAGRHWYASLRRGAGVAAPEEGRRQIVIDLLVALAAMALLAVLQNIDVIVFGRQAPHLSGSYAAISVAAKAIVFGAFALGGYLLPEAAIRWQEGGHALRQLMVTLLLLAVPALGLVVVAVAFPHLLLTLVFSARYLGAERAFLPLTLAMVCLSVTVVLTMYLLAVGARWISALLAVGAAAATVAVVEAHGHPVATARADLVVQALLALVVAVCFAMVHRRRLARR